MAWKGFNTIAAFADNSNAWSTGTAQAVGASHQIYITSEGLTPDAQLIPSESLTGSPFPAKGDKGDEFHAGPVSVEYDYETIHRLFAFAMGTAGAPTEQESDVAYQHQIRLADSLEGVYSTWVLAQSGLFVREYPLVKHNGFSLSVEHNQRVTGDFGLIPRGLNFNTTSGTNELTTLPNISLPSNADTRYLTFNDLTVRINASGSGALSASDDVDFVSGVTLEVPGAFAEDDVTTSNAPYVDEPLRDGDVLITGAVNIARLNNTDFLAEALSKDTMKMSWTFTGSAVAGGSTARSVTFWFSNVQFVQPDINVGGKNKAPKNLTFQCAKPTAAHTGFDFADAMYIDVVNGDGIDPLSNSWPTS